MPAPRQRHVPIRTCIGCRQERPKRELVRIVRSPAGVIGIDTTGRAAGRGAYLCRDSACWTRALRKGMLAGALRTTVTPDDRVALERACAELLGPAPAGADAH